MTDWIKPERPTGGLSSLTWEEYADAMEARVRELEGENTKLANDLTSAREATVIVRMQENFDLTAEEASRKLYFMWQKAFQECNAAETELATLRSRQGVPEWISVEERLPDEGVRVLVSHVPSSVEAPEQYVASHHPMCTCTRKWHGTKSYMPITHWQPLPLAPQQVTMRDPKGRFLPQLGMYVDPKGYWRYSAGPDRGRRVHRVLMEKAIGRPLRRDEVVHHRDGDKLNNEDHADGKWNLELMGEREHNAVSAKQLWFLRNNVWNREEREFAESMDAVDPGKGDVTFETERM